MHFKFIYTASLSSLFLNPIHNRNCFYYKAKVIKLIFFSRFTLSSLILAFKTKKKKRIRQKGLSRSNLLDFPASSLDESWAEAGVMVVLTTNMRRSFRVVAEELPIKGSQTFLTTSVIASSPPVHSSTININSEPNTNAHYTRQSFSLLLAFSRFRGNPLDEGCLSGEQLQSQEGALPQAGG